MDVELNQAQVTARDALAPGSQPAVWSLGNGRACVQPWIEELWSCLPRPRAVLVLLETVDHRLELAGIRPPSAPAEPLRPLIDQVLLSGIRATAHELEGLGPWRLVQPGYSEGRIAVVVCVELEADPGLAAADVATRVEWGMGWLVMALAQERQAHEAAWLERSRRLFDTTLLVLGQEDFPGAGLAAVNALAAAFSADLVQLGWWRKHGVHVTARSGTAWHDSRAVLVEQAGQVMSEALDLGVCMNVTVADQAATAPAGALAAYLRSAGAGAALVVPIRDVRGIAGALLLERKAPFTKEEQASVEGMALVLGPVLALSHGKSKSLWRHAKDDVARALRRITDSSRPGLKLGLALVVMSVAFLGTVDSTHRVAAPCLVEGQRQLSLAAPFAGFIREAYVRAGDTVRNGQVLAVMDERDLQLERARWEADLQVSLRKEREAMAAGQRVEQRLAAAQADQARAQLDLVLDRLARLEVRAGFDGFVLSGDLSQQLGAPVEQGKVLFEVAPLEAWRVVLKVDERDVAHVVAGQSGEMVLTSLPGEKFKVRVSSVTSVAIAEDGRNSFRVEATLEEASPRMRPAMAGIAKLDAGPRSLAWIWSHRLMDWLRITAWEWWP